MELELVFISCTKLIKDIFFATSVNDDGLIAIIGYTSSTRVPQINTTMNTDGLNQGNAWLLVYDDTSKIYWAFIELRREFSVNVHTIRWRQGR